jgi:hypothetical protein
MDNSCLEQLGTTFKLGQGQRVPAGFVAGTRIDQLRVTGLDE